MKCSFYRQQRLCFSCKVRKCEITKNECEKKKEVYFPDRQRRISRRHTTHILLSLVSELTAEMVVELKVEKMRSCEKVERGRKRFARHALKFGSAHREYATEYYSRFNKLQKEVDPSQLDQSTLSFITLLLLAVNHFGYLNCKLRISATGVGYD